MTTSIYSLLTTLAHCQSIAVQELMRCNSDGTINNFRLFFHYILFLYYFLCTNRRLFAASRQIQSNWACVPVVVDLFRTYSPISSDLYYSIRSCLMNEGRRICNELSIDETVEELLVALGTVQVFRSHQTTNVCCCT